MIRVIYRWEVEAENFDRFRDTWRETTNRIHATVPGALGSFMLKGDKNQCEVITVAKWKSYEDWENFWGNSDPKDMAAMRKLGKRLSVETYHEVEDHTR